MMLLILFSIFIFVHGQLSVDEIFSFNSKYTSTGNCSDFQYNFTSFQIKSNNYNQLIFNCESSNIILRNRERISSSSFCSDDENALNDFLIHIHYLPQNFIEVNQLHLHGIELCSLDNLIQNHYTEFSYYRSQWALLINLQTNNNKQEQYHLAITTNGEMTFILFILSSEYDKISETNQIELIFPNKNIFKFNQSSTNIWRIDQGFVHSPKSLGNPINYELSKTKFTLFNNETFFVYGTQLLNLRRFSVSIDQTSVMCSYDHILQCTFPILPLNIDDTHEPVLKVIYNWRLIFNTTLTLNSRIRLNQVPTNQSITSIAAFKIHLDENLCITDSLQSLFILNIHLRTEDGNGTIRYEEIVKDDIGPIDCNTTAEIGRDLANIISSIPINDITLMNVDLIHQWYEYQNCPAERTRINFISQRAER